jgi:hypothetical protein
MPARSTPVIVFARTDWMSASGDGFGNEKVGGCSRAWFRLMVSSSSSPAPRRSASSMVASPVVPRGCCCICARSAPHVGTPFTRVLVSSVTPPAWNGAGRGGFTGGLARSASASAHTVGAAVAGAAGVVPSTWSASSHTDPARAGLGGSVSRRSSASVQTLIWLVCSRVDVGSVLA